MLTSNFPCFRTDAPTYTRDSGCGHPGAEHDCDQCQLSACQCVPVQKPDQHPESVSDTFWSVLCPQSGDDITVRDNKIAPYTLCDKSRSNVHSIAFLMSPTVFSYCVTQWFNTVIKHQLGKGPIIKKSNYVLFRYISLTNLRSFFRALAITKFSTS